MPLAHVAGAWLSSWQVNVAPPSFATNVNVADVEFVGSDGPDWIVATGAAVSTVNERAAGDGSTLPARSTALTANVWAPSARCGSAWPLEQAGTGFPSTVHWKSGPASVVESNVKLGVGS